MPYAYTDGPVQAGLCVLNIWDRIGGDLYWLGVPDAELSIEQPTSRYEKTNELGEVDGACAVRERLRGSVVVYLPEIESWDGPRPGDVIVEVVNTEGNYAELEAMPWVITQVEMLDTHDYRKARLSFVSAPNVDM